MPEIIPAPNFAALKTARHPKQEPNFTHVTGENETSFWLRVAVDWGDGAADGITEDLCPANEGHTLFAEVLDEHIERLKRVLTRRRNQPPPPDTKP